MTVEIFEVKTCQLYLNVHLKILTVNLSNNYVLFNQLCDPFYAATIAAQSNEASHFQNQNNYLKLILHI